MMAKPIGFTATATPTLDYLHHDKGGALTAARVEWAENFNCIQASAAETERMWAQLVADAPELKRQAGGSSRGRRLEKPFAQYVFSWHPEEHPSRDHILDSVKDGMNKLGYGRCQYRVVAHQDTDHVHAHVIACRVHPENGRAMGRKNDGDRLREWSLDYEKAQGRIRVPGRLDDLTNRRRHAREKRSGQQPTPASPAVKRRRRERRRRRRTTRDAIGRPVVLTENEREGWATLLRADPSRGEKAALKRRQTAARLEDQRQRVARLNAAAPRRPAPPPVAIPPKPERPRQDLAHIRITTAPAIRPPRPLAITTAPERPRAAGGRTHFENPAPKPAPPPVAIAPRPERPRQDLAHVHVEDTEPVAAPEPMKLAARPERPRADLAHVRVENPEPAATPAPVKLAPRPEEPPSLEDRYRKHYSGQAFADDVDHPEWQEAKALLEDHATSGGRRSKLQREYQDCFQRKWDYGTTRSPATPSPLPDCLSPTDDPPPADEPEPVRAIEAYERSLPDAYLGLWRELDIVRRAREAIAKVSSKFRKAAAAFGLGSDPTTAVREECGSDAQAFDRDMRADREQRRPVLDIIGRIRQMERAERDQAERDRQLEEYRTRPRIRPTPGRSQDKTPLR